MRLVRIYGWIKEQFLSLTQTPKIAPFGPKKASNISTIRSKLRVRIEGNIEKRNCHCIRVDYDDDNEEDKREDTGGGREGEGRDG